jgi:predicted histone-like DNA-binding protein
MALKVKAVERNLKFSKDDPGIWRFVMQPELYSSLAEGKVIREAALRSGVSEGVMKACWDAAGEVIKAWLPEGHSVPLPGLGTARFGLSAKTVENVNDVKSSLIKTRRIVFTPAVELKDELKNTAIVITCYDRTGKEVKRVTSTDPGTVEETDGEDTNGTDNGGSSTGSDTAGGSGSDTGNGGDGSGTAFALTITKTGTGSSSVKDANNQVILSGTSVASGASVNISIDPAEGKVPTVTLNGESVSLTENDGTYTGSFQMPAQASTLVIDSGTDDNGGGNGDDY